MMSNFIPATVKFLLAPVREKIEIVKEDTKLYYV